MEFDVLAAFIYVGGVIAAILIVAIFDYRIKFLRQKQKNYFLKRDRERYAETIYASKDGYFAFIYPDENIKDPIKTCREHCSRRLAVMLNLKDGKQSSFEDVLSAFYKEDSNKLSKYLNLMRDEGIAFEDTFTLKSTQRDVRIFGNRIHALDGNLFCDMLWFRDLSKEQIKIDELEKSLLQKDKYIHSLEDLVDNLDTPIYLKNQKCELVALNKRYALLLGCDLRDNITKERKKFEWENQINELEQKAMQTHQQQKGNLQILIDGFPRYFELHENPFHNSGKLDEMGTVGQLIDMTDLVEAKRQFRVHQNAHLDVLSALGTAFAIFDGKMNLIFYNKSFMDMWHFRSDELTQQFTYDSFLDVIQNKRLLPDVSDFKEYKRSQKELLSSLLEPKEDLLHLPDDRTLRRLIAPHPNGFIFAYEDVSDKLAAERKINELLSVQKSFLDNVSEAVLIFHQDGHLKYFNPAYLKLFQIDVSQMEKLSDMIEVFETQKKFFTKVDNWENLKQHMLHHIFEINAIFKLELDDTSVLEVKPNVLEDATIMVSYQKV